MQNIALAQDQLRNVVSKIEKLDRERKETSELISDAYKEAKSAGIDVKALKQVLKLRRMKENERLELEEITKIYLDTLEGRK